MEKRKIDAKIICDSINVNGNRITTIVGVLPRIVLAELNTHRMLSRNSASSRAIPYHKMLKRVTKDPFIPIAFQKDYKGMQGVEYLDMNKEYSWGEIWSALHGMLMKAFKNEETSEWDEDYQEIDLILNEYVLPLLKENPENRTIKSWWLIVRDFCVAGSAILSAFGVTKQLCNRLLEPFMWHEVIITATEWENFFHLRCPQYSILTDPETEIVGRSWKDILKAPYTGDFENCDILYKLECNKSQAEIHIARFAECIWDAMNESTPKQLKSGEWHIPFGDNIDEERLDTLIIDIKLYKNLSNAGHWSPFEHCAKAMDRSDAISDEFCRSGNFKGFVQLRKITERRIKNG